MNKAVSYMDKSKECIVITDCNYYPQIVTSVVLNISTADSGVIEQDML